MSFADTMRKNIIKYFEAIRVAFAVLLAIGMIMIVIFFVSDQPMDVLYWLVIGPVTTLRRFGTIIELLIPLAFCGLGMCMMFQVNRFNLSCDSDSCAVPESASGDFSGAHHRRFGARRGLRHRDPGVYQ